MRVDRYGAKIITDAGGDYTSVIQCTEGLLYQIKFEIGSLDATTDLTITDISTDLEIYSQENISADFTKYPRVLESLNTDGTVLTTHDYMLIQGNVRVTIAQGGNANSGGIKLFVVR